MASPAEIKEIHNALIGFNKRAERATEAVLVATFVDSEPLFGLLSTPNNQVIYGRRGTGKTHALKYLAEVTEKRGERPIYLDLRSVGSNGSIYADATKPLAERASTLLLDVINGLFDELYSLALLVIGDHPNPEELTRRLDALQAALTSIKIEGSTESEEANTEKAESKDNRKAELGLGATFKAIFSGSSDRSRSAEQKTMTRRTGTEIAHIVFGDIAAAIGNLLDMLGDRRIWLLIDEWSEIPVDLQPYLADLIRRTLLPINGITIKIAAIEHRSSFAILKDGGEYIGLELGADISADLNLDDFLVFDNDQDKATEFLKSLLFKHYQSSDEEKPKFSSADEFLGTIFTQFPVFEEYVRAVEGVPRDALNLAAKVATRAYGQLIAMNHVRSAARDWYNQDKAAAIRSNANLEHLLAHIIDRVIANRRARAFLFPTNRRDADIEKLFDARLLHILKKNVSSHDEPGKRYDVYKIDYGCYVDLINTTKAPQGLLDLGEEGYIEVPRDDYRSIRRAILDPEELAKARVAT